VTGAAVGNRLADEVGVADRLGVTDALGVAERLAVVVAVGNADGNADGLVEALVVTLGAAPGAVLGTLVDVAEPVTEGEKIGVDGDGVDVQPETTAEPSMVKVPKPMAVNLVLSAVPAMVVRTFIQPPHAPASGDPFLRSRHDKPASEAKTCSRPVCQSTDDHKGNAQDRRRHAMARSRLEY
jgi:hypothetical protein